MKTKNEQIELAAFFVTELEPELHMVTCKPVFINQQQFEELFKTEMLLSGNKKVQLIAELGSLQGFSIDTANYARDAGADCYTANAMIVRTSIAKMVINFFINVTKPKYPIKIFSDIESAKAWLDQLKNEQKNN